MAARDLLPRTRTSRLAAGILLGGTLTAVAAFWMARDAESARGRARFDAAVSEARGHLVERLRTGEDLLRGIRGRVQSGGPLDRASFRALVESMGLPDRYAGLLGASFGIPLAPGGREALEARLRAEHGDPPPVLYPRTGLEGDTIVIFAEPAATNSGALGFNSASSPEQRDSLLGARDSGDLRASPPMPVVQAPGAGLGLVLRLAVYEGAGVPGSVPERREAYAGCANAIFLLEQLAARASVRLELDGVRVRMADVTDPDRPLPFLEGGGDLPGAWWHALGPDPLSARATLDVGGRRWDLDFRAGPSFFQVGECVNAPAVGLGVLLVTLLLSALVASVSRTGERARDLARRMTQDLRLSESRLKAIARVMPDVILVLDADGRYREVHTGDPDGLVAPPGELLGRALHDVLPPALADRALEVIARALGEERIQTLDYEVRTLRGPAHFEARIAPLGIEIEGRPCVIWVARDVTERRAQEEAHLQAQKLEGLGLLAGGIAHDFNNLLAAIQGYLSLGRLALEAGQDPAGHLDRMESSIQRAADLARQLLAYSGHASFRTERLDLNDLVREMSELLGVSRPKNVALEVRLAPSLPPVRGDRAQLQQVVMNLVTNAGEAMGGRPGTVTLSTGTEGMSAADLEQRMPGQALAPGRYVTLTVSDTGCGMSDEVLARIFDPFFTTKPTGRGLGLSALRGILRFHDAGIVIRSAPGQGSTFAIHFPAAEGPAGRQPDSGLVPSVARPLRGTLLVVDDEPSLRETTRAMAEHLGFAVVEAADGQEALEIFEARRDELSCVVMDLTMPRMGGAEAYRLIRERAPRFPLVLCSGYNREALPRVRAPDEPTGVLQKPFTFRQLESALRRVMAQSEA